MDAKVIQGFAEEQLSDYYNEPQQQDKNANKGERRFQLKP